MPGKRFRTILRSICNCLEAARPASRAVSAGTGVMTIQVCPNCGAKNRVDELTARQKQPVCGKCGAPLSQAAVGDSQPQVVTDASFDADVIGASSARPVLVDAWAEWCG